MKRRLLGLAILPLLAGCPAPLTRLVVERPSPAAVPADMKQPCNAVVDIPENTLESPARTAPLWAADRQSLGDCGRKNAALVGVIEAIEGQGE